MRTHGRLDGRADASGGGALAGLSDLAFSRTQHNTYLISFHIKFPANGHERAVAAFQQELASIPGLIRMEEHRES